MRAGDYVDEHNMGTLAIAGGGAMEDALTHLGRRVYTALVLWPAQQMYIRGVWNGLPPEDVCAHLTRHRSQFWRENVDECMRVIYANFDAWIVCAQTLLYVLVTVYVAYRALRCVLDCFACAK